MNQSNQAEGVRSAQSSGEKRSINIGGDANDAVIIQGDNNNVIVHRSDQRVTVKPLATPIFVNRPNQEIPLLDRETERDAVQHALMAGEALEFYASEGFGKTVLARHLASALQLPDGMIYLSVKNKSLNDVFAILFGKFYECDQKFTPLDYSGYFEKIRALIFLDDVTLSRDEIQNLLITIPACVFVFSSSERRVWDGGTSIHLSGLSADLAVQLFEQKIQRALSDEEKTVVAKICSSLKYNPLHIVQAAESGVDLRQVQSEQSLYQQVLAAIPESEKPALTLLATIGSAPLPIEHISVILNEKNPQAVLDDLLRRNLVEAHSPRYSIAEGFGRYIVETWNISQWQDAVIKYFVNWTSRSVSDVQVLDAAEALFSVLGFASAQERWREVLQIGRSIESALIYNSQWGDWNRLLNILLQAARALGDRFAEAWVLHQMGSRALALKDVAQAKELLSRALEIRKAIGDKVGIQATQHNLQHMIGKIGGGSNSCLRWFTCGGISALVLAGIVILVVIFWPHPSAPPQIVTDTTIVPATTEIPVTITLSDTLMPSETPTPSLTPTFTATYTPVAPALDLSVIVPDISQKSPMLYQSKDGQNYFEVPVNVSVVNKGPVAINDGFDFVIYFSGTDGYHASDFRIDGSPNYQSDAYQQSIAVGQTIPILVWMKIPITYQGSQLSIFARVGECEKKVFQCQYHDINVKIPSTVFDFISYAPKFNWYGIDPNASDNYSLQLKFGSSINDSIGSVAFENGQFLEDKSQPDEVLRTHPRWVADGQVIGVYDLTGMSFQKGDMLAIRVGYLAGAGQSDGVTFSVSCQTPFYKSFARIFQNSNIVNVQDNNDGIVRDAVVLLPDIVTNGNCPYFYLMVDAGPSPNSDWAVWVSAFIERP